MTQRQQKSGVRCARCSERLHHHDRRPRSLQMRIRHRNSRLYLCPDCGTKNLVLNPPVDDGISNNTVSVGRGEDAAVVSRYHEIQRRIARNRRAYAKLREMIESDRRLLERLADDRALGG